MQAVLFDLDGTLLNIDLDSFLRDYFTALEAAASGFSVRPGSPPVLAAIKDSTSAMMRPHPGRTNREVFYEDFHSRTGVDLNSEWQVFEDFYADEFPGLMGSCRPMPGARTAVESVLDLGLRVAIATNPIFPMAAVRHRLMWAGLDDLPLDVITTYETMHACKPFPEYFRQTAELVGVSPSECMMVGDDRFLDLPAADAGMRTFYVGSDPDATADYFGDLKDLSGLLPRLISNGD